MSALIPHAHEDPEALVRSDDPEHVSPLCFLYHLFPTLLLPVSRVSAFESILPIFNILLLGLLSKSFVPNSFTSTDAPFHFHSPQT
jgi:hypothetical protein